MNTLRPAHHSPQRGAALLLALLVVTLVATFSTAALWRQWRATEVEAAERARLQSAWVLLGALDWSRLILAEDGRTGGADHLSEPWAVPLAEARLTSFLAADQNIASDALEGLPDAFLSGQVLDAQARLNVRNLVQNGQPVPGAVAAFQKLFDALGLPVQEVNLLVAGLRRADPQAVAGDAELGLLMPQHLSQLAWFGLPASTLAAIEPHVTVLPAAAPVNVNTAGAQVLFASVPDLDMASAQRLMAARQRQFFASLAQAAQVVQPLDIQFIAGQHGVATQYFEVHGRLRIDHLWVEEQSLVVRDGVSTRVVWRQRGAGHTPLAPLQSS